MVIYLERRIETRQLADIVILFLIVQFAGLLVLIYSTPPQDIYAISSQTLPASQAPSYLLEIIVFLLIFVVALLLLFKLYHGNFIYKGIEAYAIGLPSFYLFLVIISTILPASDIIPALIISIVLAAGLIIAKNKNPRLLNLAAMTASIGLGLLVGGVGFTFAYLLFGIFAVYDYIAVFVTKHMQVMARELSDRNLAFLIGSSDTEVMPKNYMSQKEKTEFKKTVKVKEIKDPMIKKLVEQGNIPTVSRVALGAGDLGFPLIVSVGAYITFENVFVPLMVIIGAGLGLIATMQILKRYQVPLPALPPIFAFINLLLAINFIIFSPHNYLYALGFFLVFAVTLMALQLTMKKIERSRMLAVQNAAGS